jgi:hypothetical protein
LREGDVKDGGNTVDPFNGLGRGCAGFKPWARSSLSLSRSRGQGTASLGRSITLVSLSHICCGPGSLAQNKQGVLCASSSPHMLVMLLDNATSGILRGWLSDGCRFDGDAAGRGLSANLLLVSSKSGNIRQAEPQMRARFYVDMTWDCPASQPQQG